MRRPSPWGQKKPSERLRQRDRGRDPVARPTRDLAGKTVTAGPRSPPAHAYMSKGTRNSARDIQPAPSTTTQIALPDFAETTVQARMDAGNSARSGRAQRLPRVPRRRAGLPHSPHPLPSAQGPGRRHHRRHLLGRDQPHPAHRRCRRINRGHWTIEGSRILDDSELELRPHGPEHMLGCGALPSAVIPANPSPPPKLRQDERQHSASNPPSPDTDGSTTQTQPGKASALRGPSPVPGTPRKPPANLAPHVGRRHHLASSTLTTTRPCQAPLRPTRSKTKICPVVP